MSESEAIDAIRAQRLTAASAGEDLARELTKAFDAWCDDADRGSEFRLAKLVKTALITYEFATMTPAELARRVADALATLPVSQLAREVLPRTLP